MIEIFSVTKTEELLASGRISEGVGIRYYSAGVMLACLVTQYSIWIGASPTVQFLMESILTIAISGWGLYFWWESNGKNEGRSFVTRVVCLSVPVGLATFMLNFVLGWAVFYFALHLFGGGTFRDPERAYGFVSYSISFGTYLLYWLWVGRILKRLKNAQGDI